MGAHPQFEAVATQDGSLTVRHPGHGECFHSVAGAAAEAWELYVVRGGLRESLAGAGPVNVLDVGLGLGYNALATIRAWRESARPAALSVTSLEIDAELLAGFLSGRAPWQINWGEADLDAVSALVPNPSDPNRWDATLRHPSAAASTCTWTIHLGDAATQPLPAPPAGAGWTHVWQDPFSPDKNPPLWSPAWFGTVRRGAASGCRLMSYSVARSVKDALTEAGWVWERIGTPWPTKRHWLRAVPTL